MNSRGFVFVIIISALGFSCDFKSEENLVIVETTKHNTDKLFSLSGIKKKQWKVDTYNVNGKNLLKEMSDCQTDNLDIYFSDHRFESVEGATKCKENDPYITENGHWHFNEDSTEIEVSIEKDFYILKIIELLPSKFHYKSCNHGDTIEAVLLEVK